MQIFRRLWKVQCSDNLLAISLLESGFTTWQGSVLITSFLTDQNVSYVFGYQAYQFPYAYQCFGTELPTFNFRVWQRRTSWETQQVVSFHYFVPKKGDTLKRKNTSVSIRGMSMRNQKVSRTKFRIKPTVWPYPRKYTRSRLTDAKPFWILFKLQNYSLNPYLFHQKNNWL